MKERDKIILGLGVMGSALAGYYLMRGLGKKKFTIVYWNADDLPTAKMLESKLKKYYSVSVVYGQENPKSDYVIQLGGQYVNPVYKKYMQAGKLPVISQNYSMPGSKTIGNTVFIAGWSKEDTYATALNWIKNFLGVKA